MQSFTERTIVPKGRFKYGEYMSAGNVTSKVQKTIYAGNGSTEDLGGGTGGNTGGTETLSWQLFLSKGTYAFDGATLSAVGSQSAETSVIGVLGTEVAETYVGDVTGDYTEDILLSSTSVSSRYISDTTWKGVLASAPEDPANGWCYYDATKLGYFYYSSGWVQMDSNGCSGDCDYVPSELPANYGITGIPTTGMVVVVNNNGDAGTTIEITVDNTLPASANTGTLYIPCAVSLKQNQLLENSIVDWEAAYKTGKATQLVLEFSWSVSSNAQSAYRLDLSNDSGSINCDEDGNVLTGATRPSCQATLYFGNDPYTAATYNVTYNNSQNVTGLGFHTSNGVCYIDYDSPTYFNFDGDHLDVTITAYASSVPQGTKVFTITKSMPSEGHPATSYWMVFNSTSVKVNPNTTPATVTPTAITAEVMMQVGQETPTAATGCSIFYGYTTSPATAYPSTGVTVDVSKEALYFVAKKGTTIVDGVEQIPILKDGEKGAAGQSAYRLDLSNENASINCDSDGNILSGAMRPTCQATLYLGTTACTGVTYSIASGSCSFSGVTINSSTGVLTFNAGTHSTPFWFDTSYTCLELNIEAKIGNVLYGSAVMSISRSIAGSDGTPARSYWLAMSADAIRVNSADTATPSSITATAYAQIGDGTPYIISNVIKWGYNGSTSNTYTSAITVDTTKNYMTFRLMLDDIQRDIETVPILHDGKNGEGTQGRRGPAIRGPIDWYDGANQSGRRWCNGEGPLETDKDWIDIIIKDGTTYRCITSYTEQGLPWSSVSSNWTAATEYDFVATNLLLASAASINFLTNNELYLRDSNGNITGGAAGGDGINFWAGAEQPGDAEFQVWADGTMRATAGVFAGYIQTKYNFVTDLAVDYQISGSSVTSRYLSETNFLGVMNQDPPASASTSGDCYFNPTLGNTSVFTTGGTSITGVYRVYRTSWVTANNRKSGSTNISRGYMADNRAYLIADSATGNYGMGDGGTLVLPAPSAALNGFVYDIMVDANYATRSQGTEFAGLYVIIGNYSSGGDTSKFYPYSFSSGNQGVANYLELFGGRTRFVCVPRREVIGDQPYYVWAITDATGGFKLYNGSTFVASYMPIQGYSNEEMYDPIYRIHAYHTAPGSKSNDILYVSRD